MSLKLRLSDVITLLINTFHGKAYIDYSALRVSLAEKIDLKHNVIQKTQVNKVKGLYDSALPALSEKGKEDSAQFSRWMESNRFPASTVQTYSAIMVKFLRFNSPKEASECTSADLVRIVEEYILPNGLSFSFQNQMISA